MIILAFLVTIGILVTIHEFGHFQVARWCGVKVLQFSIGFGRPLYEKSFGADQTKFILGSIPLGGYVKMLDENDLDSEKDEEQNEHASVAKVNFSESDLARAFNRQSVYKRIAIVLAGPLANLILAVALYWGLIMQGEIGIRPVIGDVKANSSAAEASLSQGQEIRKIDGKPIFTWQDARWALLELSLEKPTVSIETLNHQNELHVHELHFGTLDNKSEVDIFDKVGLIAFMPNFPPVIGDVLPNSPAEKMGFRKDDLILSIDQVSIHDWVEVVKTVQASPNKRLSFKLMRGQNKIDIEVSPEAVIEKQQTIGRLGASVKPNQIVMDKLLIKQYYSPLASLVKAVDKTLHTATFSLKMFWYMIIGKVSWHGISGPVTIATYAGESAELGLKPYLEFLALVSISIGILNLLPIPVLDGGHLMYHIAEIFKGSPVSTKVMLIGQKLGFGLLGFLMIVALYNDLNRLFQ